LLETCWACWLLLGEFRNPQLLAAAQVGSFERTPVQDRHQKRKNLNHLAMIEASEMVGPTGIEPVTPTMST